MKMSGIVTMCILRTGAGFLSKSLPSASTITSSSSSNFLRLFASSSSTFDVKSGVSRMETLQTLLSKHGAPGSTGCSEADDLEPVFVEHSDVDMDETPELIASIMGLDEYLNLHPHLYPLARSKKTGHLICALRRSFGEDNGAYETGANAPWPIVEAKLGGRGMKLLALNSEHLMRRIACECDLAGENEDLVSLYNEGLGQSLINDKNLDTPYEAGSVAKLGYGVDKYVLLRVGPFQDIYETLALGHAKNGDESSALISAEAANGKISGFASTFRFYARLLSTFPNREEETRDAARMCLRLPLPSIGLDTEEFREVAILGQIADESDSDEEAIAKLQRMYEKIRAHEQEEDPRSAGAKTPEQQANDEATYLLDTVALAGGSWKEVRPKIAKIYADVGRTDMANFVNPSQ